MLHTPSSTSLGKRQLALIRESKGTVQNTARNIFIFLFHSCIYLLCVSSHRSERDLRAKFLKSGLFQDGVICIAFLEQGLQKKNVKYAEEESQGMCVCPLDGPAGQRETSLESGFEGRNQCDGWMAGHLKGSWGSEARFQQVRGFPSPGQSPMA